MKKLASILVFALLMAAAAFAAAQDVLYTATVSKTMTIRAKKSTSAGKLGSVEPEEFFSVLEYGSEWTKIEKDGKVGYVLTKNVTELTRSGAYNDEAEAVYTGVAARELTIRKERDTGAQRMNMLAEGEKVYLLELDNNWHRVVKNGVEGYVLSEHVTDLAACAPGAVVPEEYLPFEALYKAMADVNLSIRKDKDADSKLLGTIYEKEYVEVMSTDGEWARVRKDGATGYVRADHLRYFERFDPYGPYVPGTVWYPYAAHVTADTEVFDAATGELLRTVPAGSILSVSALGADMTVTLPYDRTTGKIAATGNLELEVVKPWYEAQMGDLIAVFSTYYDPVQETMAEQNRLHNMQMGVDRLNDLILPVGEKFYFNDYCAPYTLSNGYLEGPIINYVSSDKLGPGGGICQVSTTLYNAILQIPIEVIKWQVHSSYGISYAPLDFDAAVGNGNIDLRLLNALSYDVRFAMQIGGGVLTVRVYRAS